MLNVARMTALSEEKSIVDDSDKSCKERMKAKSKERKQRQEKQSLESELRAEEEERETFLVEWSLIRTAHILATHGYHHQLGYFDAYFIRSVEILLKSFSMRGLAYWDSTTYSNIVQVPVSLVTVRYALKLKATAH